MVLISSGISFFDMAWFFPAPTIMKVLFLERASVSCANITGSFRTCFKLLLTSVQALLVKGEIPTAKLPIIVYECRNY